MLVVSIKLQVSDVDPVLVELFVVVVVIVDVVAVVVVLLVDGVCAFVLSSSMTVSTLRKAMLCLERYY